MNRRVIAIDGAAGSGKSTLSRRLAGRLGLPYVNTGLMYRALAAAALRAGVHQDDGSGLTDLASSLRFRFGGSSTPELEVEGFSPEELTSLEVEATVSAVSSHPEVRALLRERQRAIGEPGAVMEGRDIGSVVFPDAVVKLYLVAAPSVRAERRASERPAASEAVRNALERRDRQDASTNPFLPPDGADVLDTGVLDPDAAMERALEVVASRAPWLLTEGIHDG